MAEYIITGGVTGIGAAVKKQLLAQGHNVFVVDLKNADIDADLSDEQQLDNVIEQLQQRFVNGVDGFIPCAGVGPNTQPYSLIARINYTAVVMMTRALEPLLVKKQGAVVLVGSNSAAFAGLNEQYIQYLLAGEYQQAYDLVDTLDGHNAYAGSKQALLRWMRQNNQAYAAQQIRLNAVAPGITQTPLTDKVFADEVLGQMMQDFAESVPLGRVAKPDDIANVISFLLGQHAAFVSGSVFFVDGGHDAMMRPEQF